MRRSGYTGLAGRGSCCWAIPHLPGCSDEPHSKNSCRKMVRARSQHGHGAGFGFGWKKEGEITGYESEWRRSDGALVFLREHARTIRGPNQETVCYEGTLEDISDRRAAEKQIQTERDFSSAVIDAAGTLVVILNCQGQIVRFNQAAESLSGYSLHEVAGRPIWEVFSPPGERDSVRQCYQKLAAGEFPGSHECSWLVRSGGLRQITWSDSALVDGQGAIRNVISMGIDITERIAAEEALRLSEAAIANCSSLPAMLFPYKPGRTHPGSQRGGRTAYGIRPKRNPPSAQFLDPEHLALVRERLEARINGAPGGHLELPYRTASGTYIYLDLQASMRYENGKPVEVLGIVAISLCGSWGRSLNAAGAQFSKWRLAMNLCLR